MKYEFLIMHILHKMYGCRDTHFLVQIISSRLTQEYYVNKFKRECQASRWYVLCVFHISFYFFIFLLLKDTQILEPPHEQRKKNHAVIIILHTYSWAIPGFWLVEPYSKVGGTNIRSWLVDSRTLPKYTIQMDFFPQIYEMLFYIQAYIGQVERVLIAYKCYEQQPLVGMCRSWVWNKDNWITTMVCGVG